MFKVLSLCSMVLVFHGIKAQPLPVRISLLNESTSMPFTRGFSTPVHPGVDVGTEFDWRESKYFRFYPTVSVGYMFHRHLFQAVYLNGSLGIDFKFDFGLTLKSNIGAGYMHTFTTQQEYQFKNGRYESKGDRGNSRVTPSLALGLGYKLKPKEQSSPEIFTLYQTWLEYPYSPGFIPLMAHTNLHLGYKFYPFQSSAN